MRILIALLSPFWIAATAIASSLYVLCGYLVFTLCLEYYTRKIGLLGSFVTLPSIGYSGTEIVFGTAQLLILSFLSYCTLLVLVGGIRNMD